MILTTAITWGWELLPLGVLAGANAYAIWQWRKWKRWQRAAWNLRTFWADRSIAMQTERDALALRVFSHEVKEAQAKHQRHMAAKHARSVQLARKRLATIGKAQEIRREMGR
jgi:hypothetical protein